ncbi:MAG: hypothetical protein ACFFCI_20740, partial [Promethearchaeota archaeon]
FFKISPLNKKHFKYLKFKIQSFPYLKSLEYEKEENFINWRFGPDIVMLKPDIPKLINVGTINIFNSFWNKYI